MRALVVLAIALVAGGCRLSADVEVQSASCENTPNSVCTEQVRVAANAAGAPVADVIVTCNRDVPCTRAHGSGTTTVRRPDGTQVTRAWTYIGDPGPDPVPACVGIPDDVCRREVNGAMGDVPVDKRLVQITVTCTDERCDTNAGHIRIDYVFGDGSKDSVQSGWSP
jgi:hypothetical protein